MFFTRLTSESCWRSGMLQWIRPEPAVQRHGDRHGRLGDGVHVGGDDRDAEVQSFRERGLEVRIAREDFRKERREGDVVVGQRNAVLSWEEWVSSQVEAVVQCRGWFCHGRE